MATLPTYQADYKELPTYTAPTWDESEISSLTQQRAAPGLRAMRQQMNRASGASYDNPNAKRMTLRDALAGYGTGIANVLGTAGTEATNEYGEKYARESTNKQAEYTSQANQASAYNAAKATEAAANYQGGLAQYQNLYQTEDEIESEKRAYDWQQKSLDAAWERWKTEEQYKRTLPSSSGGSGTSAATPRHSMFFKGQWLYWNGHNWGPG